MAWIIVGYMVLYIHRPFEVWPWMGAFQLERVYAIGMLVAMFAHARRPYRCDLPTLSMCALAMVFGLSVMFSPWYGSGTPIAALIEWSKILVMYFVVVAAIRNRDDARILVLGLAIAIAIYVGHSVWEYYNGRHSWRGQFDRIQGINTTFAHAGSFCYISLIGLLWTPVVWKHFPHRWVRLAVIGYTLVATYGVLVLAGSRTGFVGLLFVVAALAFKSKYKVRFAVVGLCVAPLIWNAIPEAKKEWYESTWSAEDESADTRGESFREGVKLFQEYPLLGCGPGAWRQATGWDLVAHNLYGQLLGEVGLLGSLAFAFHIAAAYITARSLRQLTAADPDTFYRDSASALVWILTMLLFLGLAGGSLFHFYWVWVPAMLITLKRCLDEEIAAV